MFEHDLGGAVSSLKRELKMCGKKKERTSADLPQSSQREALEMGEPVGAGRARAVAALKARRKRPTIFDARMTF